MLDSEPMAVCRSLETPVTTFRCICNKRLSHEFYATFGFSVKSEDEGERFVAVLEIPPVVSAETAVRVQIVKDAKKG